MICCAIDTGTDYINIHGQSGLVVPPADSDALKKAILTLWEDPELTTKLGFGAKQRFNELFTSDRMVKNYISLYKTLVKGYHK
jgi:rhamnosyl/mannosyltransferase